LTKNFEEDLPMIRWVGVLVALSVWAVADGAEAADAASGKRVFNTCRACHKLEAGGKAIGPSLHGIFGRTAGTVADFAYSPDMAAAGKKGLVWKDETMFEYLADPKAFLGKVLGKPNVSTKMVFAGVKSEKDREDVIAFLKEATK
jgi:cytochrome c